MSERIYTRCPACQTVTGPKRLDRLTDMLMLVLIAVLIVSAFLSLFEDFIGECYKANKLSKGSLFSTVLQVQQNRIVHPGYSYCSRCLKTWDVVTAHDTDYAPGRGCFPLCEQCWKELGTADARLPYYRSLLDDWKKSDPEGHGESLWPGMKQGVIKQSEINPTPIIQFGMFTNAATITADGSFVIQTYYVSDSNVFVFTNKLNEETPTSIITNGLRSIQYCQIRSNPTQADHYTNTLHSR